MPTDHTILVATDFSERADCAALRAARLAAERRARIELLHVVAAGAAQSESQDALDRLQALADALSRTHGIDARPRLEQGDTVDRILAAALGAGLLMIGATGRHGLRQALLGAVADQLLPRSIRPVLVVRREASGPYQRVLVPVDFSPYARNALAVAADWLPTAGLVLLHAVDRAGGRTQAPRPIPEDASGDDPAIERARLGLGLVADGLRQAGHPGARLALMEGDAPGAILAQAEAMGAELIVVGKHQRSRVEDLLADSVTRTLLAQADADLLVTTAAKKPSDDSGLPPAMP